MYIPQGFGTMFPYISVSKAAEYIEFLKKALDAVEIGRTSIPNGGVANARIRIGTTSFMISEANDRLPATKSAFYLYVENANAALAKAVSNGAAKMFEPMNMPYQDRQAGITDPAGNIWWISQRLVEAAYD